MIDNPTYADYRSECEKVEILEARIARLRARIDDLTDRCEELREQRDLALHDLWKEKLIGSYWRNLARRLWRRKSEPEDSPFNLPDRHAYEGKEVAQG